MIFNRFLLCSFSFFLFCCGKNQQATTLIPSVSFTHTIYLSNPSNYKLNNVGGWVYIDKGSKGIIVYRNTQNSFLALERHCTYQPTKSCAVSVGVSNIFATDACCGSSFFIADGTVSKGPATVNLLQYNTIYDVNTNTVSISN